MKVNLKNNNTMQTKQEKIGYSWTVGLFGFWSPLFKSDWKWFLILLGVQIILAFSTSGVGVFPFTLVLGFFYNKIHIQELLNNGYQPADDFSEKSLKGSGFNINK